MILLHHSKLNLRAMGFSQVIFASMCSHKSTKITNHSTSNNYTDNRIVTIRIRNRNNSANQGTTISGSKTTSKPSLKQPHSYVWENPTSAMQAKQVINLKTINIASWNILRLIYLCHPFTNHVKLSCTKILDHQTSKTSQSTLSQSLPSCLIIQWYFLPPT